MYRPIVLAVGLIVGCESTSNPTAEWKRSFWFSVFETSPVACASKSVDSKSYIADGIKAGPEEITLNIRVGETRDEEHIRQVTEGVSCVLAAATTVDGLTIRSVHVDVYFLQDKIGSVQPIATGDAGIKSTRWPLALWPVKSAIDLPEPQMFPACADQPEVEPLRFEFFDRQPDRRTHATVVDAKAYVRVPMMFTAHNQRVAILDATARSLVCSLAYEQAAARLPLGGVRATAWDNAELENEPICVAVYAPDGDFAKSWFWRPTDTWKIQHTCR